MSPFSTKRFVFFLLTADLLLLVAALSCGVWQRNNPYAFIGEKSPITWLSFLHLLGTAGFTGAVFVARHRESQKVSVTRAPYLIWLLIASGFVFLAIDETAKLHETLDEVLHKALRIQETNFTDRIDDLIVAGYGLVGIGLLSWYREELHPYTEALTLLYWGLALFLAMLLLDTGVNRPDIVSILVGDPEEGYRLSKWIEALEDSIKILAEALFLGVAHQCFATTREFLRREKKEEIPFCRFPRSL